MSLLHAVPDDVVIAGEMSQDLTLETHSKDRTAVQRRHTKNTTRAEERVLEDSEKRWHFAMEEQSHCAQDSEPSP